MPLSSNDSKHSILENQEQHPEQIIDYLKGEPALAPLWEIAVSEGELKLPQPPLWKKLLKPLTDVAWADAETLYGRSYVTPELVTEAKTTATILSTANLINILTTYPYLYYAFAGMGGSGTVLAVVLGILLNKTGNALGEAACRNRHPKGAIAALAGTILLNVVLTLTAGPGTELLLNSSGLAEQRGRELIQEKVLDTTLQEQNLAQRQEWLKAAQADCQGVLDELHALAPDHPNRDLLYQRAYGTWSERDRDWNQVPTTNLPLCRKAAQLEQEVQVYATKLQTEQEAKQAEIHRHGTALLYLKAVHPDIYHTYFDEYGQIRSGLEASRLSLQGFTQKFSTGDLADLGFPLFYFVISLVTSGVAIAKVATFARRKDVLRSWDPAIYQLREELFYRAGKGLQQREYQDVAALPNGKVPH
ncbi:hypothetical protein BST81_23645 [Leptolyngbya sp. 'hensonii']|uniref:hypothetical protein n=1 Tax=Leptolyngbya sp. 'hensonii' TaxID=1922337 RepID=UPI00094F49D7|nr:hypothetical protein [Leptolyngbya sp. 'hensonii']OLP15923.1 hypothetical protein BST81_23645 [Leptolyngbya sp. 'hensonii']